MWGKCDQVSNEVVRVFNSSQCVYQYVSCYLYETEENTIDEINLIIQNGKCKFIVGTRISKGTYRDNTVKCFVFLFDVFRACSEIILSDSSKKCVYSNNMCSISEKLV